MKASNRKPFNQINITPLTDIFLVLMIMMMVIAPMLDAQGLKLAVPTVSENDQVEEEPKTIRLEVHADGSYAIGEQALSAGQLRQHLRKIQAEYPDGLLIETDPTATHGMVVKAMDAARGAGIDKIAVTQSDGADVDAVQQDAGDAAE